MRTSSWACFALAAWLLACEPPPPCAECGPPDAAMHDAGPDVLRDAGRDADFDAGQISPPSPPDSGQPSPPDASVDDAAAMDTTCSPEDVEAWERAHRRLDLVDVLARCAAERRCGETSCSFEECLRHVAGVEGCEACISEEITCVSRHCRAECAPGSASEHCRWCLCESGCVDELAECTGAPSSLCDACESERTRCGPLLVSPALILVIA